MKFGRRVVGLAAVIAPCMAPGEDGVSDQTDDADDQVVRSNDAGRVWKAISYHERRRSHRLLPMDSSRRVPRPEDRPASEGGQRGPSRSGCPSPRPSL